MPSITSNQRNIETSLWNLARSRWVENIHQEIGQVGSGEKKSHSRNADGVSLSDNALHCLNGREFRQKDSSFLQNRTAKHFNIQIAPDKTEDKFQVPVPKDSGSLSRKTFLSRNYPFGETGVLPYFTDHTADPISLAPERQYIKPDPNGGAFKNPVIDGIVDVAGTIADLAVYGLKDVGRTLLSFVR